MEETSTGVVVSRPRSGCDTAATTALRADESAAFTELQSQVFELQGKAMDAGRTGERIVIALAGWRDCTSRSGLTYEHPTQLYSWINKQRGTPGVQPEVDRLAAIDLSCKAETDLLAIGHQAIYDAQVELVDENPGVVDQFLAICNRMAQRAEAVLSR